MSGVGTGRSRSGVVGAGAAVLAGPDAPGCQNLARGAARRGGGWGEPCRGARTAEAANLGQEQEEGCTGEIMVGP